MVKYNRDVIHRRRYNRKMMKSPLLKHTSRVVPVTVAQASRYKLDLRQAHFAGGAYVTDDWLEIPIGDGWIAAYRLAHAGSPRAPRTRILEVRVFPDERERVASGEWSAAVLGNRAKALRQFSFERLRRGVTEKSFDAALQATRANAEKHGALEAFGHPGRGHRSDREGRGAGRPGRQRSFYALVAVRYHRIEHHSRRPVGTSTREVLRARHYPDASTAAIGKWLTTARRLGFLTKVSRGQRGAMATDIARALAEKAV